jgi:hypothetical protein
VAEEFVQARHKETGEVMDVATSALVYFPDWERLDPPASEPEPSPEPEPPVEAAKPKTTRASKATTTTEKGDD